MRVFSLYLDIYKYDKLINLSGSYSFEEDLYNTFAYFYGVRFYVENIVSKNIAKLNSYDSYSCFESFMIGIITNDDKYLRTLYGVLKKHNLKLKITYVSYDTITIVPTPHRNFDDLVGCEISGNGIKHFSMTNKERIGGVTKYNLKM